MTSIPGFIAEDLPSGSFVLQRRWVTVSTFLCGGLVFFFAAILREEHDVLRLLQPVRDACCWSFAVHNYGIIQLQRIPDRGGVSGERKG